MLSYTRGTDNNRSHLSVSVQEVALAAVYCKQLHMIVYPILLGVLVYERGNCSDSSSCQRAVEAKAQQEGRTQTCRTISRSLERRPTGQNTVMVQQRSRRQRLNTFSIGRLKTSLTSRCAKSLFFFFIQILAHLAQS